MFGPLCCFCPKGSGSIVLVARHPLGPWKDTGLDLNPTFGLKGQRAIDAQENYVFRISTIDSYNSFPIINITYIYTGDRWHSSEDGLKSHDFQYWQPLVFDDSSDPPTIEKLVWADSFTLNLV
jgi:hypothetical protein